MGVVIGYGNLIDSATLAGTWGSSANLKTRYLAQKATAVAGAYVDIDLGSAKAIGLIALVSHTIASGTVTITAGATQGATTYNPGAQSVYAGQDYAVTFAAQTYRWWRIATSAGGNIGRVFIGPRFAPAAWQEYGSSGAVETLTKVTESIGGQEFFFSRPNRRVWQGKLSWLTAAEGYSWQAVQRAQDVAGEAFLIEDDTDTTYRGIRNFYGRLRTLGAVEWPYPQLRSTAIEISELL